MTHELRKKIRAEKLINFLQALAEGRIKGSSVSERKDAAVALLRKVLPDCKSSSVSISEKKKGSDIRILCTYPSREAAASAIQNHPGRKILPKKNGVGYSTI